MSSCPTPPIAPPSPEAPATTAVPLPLVAVIELKWLAAGVGMHLHVERMQQDPRYAREVLAAAASSTSPPLRRTAVRLQAWLADPPRPR